MNMIKLAWLSLLLFSLPAVAQDNVAVSEREQAAAPAPTDIEESDAEEVGRDALEPGAPSAILVQDAGTRPLGGGAVMDEMRLSRTQITGNQELPKVMYIVPWKKSDPGDVMGRPVNTLLDEVLAPLDREEFIRQVDYYDDLYTEVEE